LKTYKIVGILFLILALGIVIIQNRGPVQTRLLFVTIEMPHIILLFLMAAGGFALGLMAALFGRAKPKNHEK